ncbi:hypothetical protein AB4267_10835 [Vibrio cyclitrophicus]
MKKLIVDFLNEYTTGKSLRVGEYLISDNLSGPCVFNINANPEIDLNETFSVAWKDYILSLGDKGGGYKCYEAVVYRRCVRPFYLWVKAIEIAISEVRPDVIVFNGYIGNGQVFLYEAEGEVNSKLLYETDFYIPFLLRKYVEKNHSEVSIVVKSKKVRFKLFCSIIRNMAMFSSVILSKFACVIALKFKKSRLRPNLENINKILIARNFAQSNYIKDFALKYKDDVILVSSEQNLKILTNDKYLTSIGLRHLIVEDYLKVTDIIQSSFYTLYEYFRIKSSLDIDLGKGVVIPTKLLIKEIVIRNFEFLLFNKGLSRLVEYEGITVDTALSLDMFSPHSFYLKSGTKANKCYQIQTALISPLREADFIVSDRFYFNSIGLLEQMKTLNPTLSKKMGFLPVLKGISACRRKKIEKVIQVTYFTQPLLEREQRYLIDLLSSIFSESGVKLLVKPHPRQNITAIEKMGITVLSKELSFEEATKNSDLVITRTSSVGDDCWMLNIPVVFVRFDRIFSNVKADFIPDGYIGDVRNEQELRDVLTSNMDLFLNEYYILSEKKESNSGVEEYLEREFFYE